MKRIFVCLLIVLMLFSTACSSSESTGNGELVVYVPNNYVGIMTYAAKFKEIYPQAQYRIKYYEYDYNDFDSNTNNLNKFKDADVVIFDNPTTDFYALAKTNTLMDLSDKINNDDTINKENYLAGTFDTGVVDGKIYAIPLTFSIPVLYHAGKNVDTITSYEDFKKLIIEENENLKNDRLRASIDTFDIGTLLWYFNAFSEDDFAYDKDYLSDIINFFKEDILYSEKYGDLNDVYGDVYLDLYKRYSYFYDYPGNLIHSVWENENAYNKIDLEEFDFSVVDAGGLTAMAESYAVLTADADSSAYDFVRIMMDTENNSNTGYSRAYTLSVNINNIKSELEYYKQNSEYIDYFELEAEPLSEKSAVKIMEIVNNIDNILIRNQYIRDDVFLYYVYEDQFFYDEYFVAEVGAGFDVYFKEFENKYNEYMLSIENLQENLSSNEPS